MSNPDPVRKKKSAQGQMGKWAEAQVEEWLERQSRAQAGFAYHRYPDSRSARNVIAAQPADFLVAEKIGSYRRAWHLEVKDTAEEKRLPRAKIGQYGKLKMFQWAGIEPYVLVFRSVFKDWVILTPEYLMSYEDAPTSFPFAGLPTYPSEPHALKEIFG